MRFQADLAERLDPGAIGIPGNKNVNHANRRRKLFSVTAAHAVGSLEVADLEKWVEPQLSWEVSVMTRRNADLEIRDVTVVSYLSPGAAGI
jgi:hypothetical protein